MAELVEATLGDCIYAAAWFDSRGYVRVGCQKGRTPRLTVHVQTGVNDAKFFTERWGGKARTVNSGRSLGNGAYTNGRYSWSLTKLPARQFLRDIESYSKFRGRLIHLSDQFIERTALLGEKTNPLLDKLVAEIRQYSRVAANA